MSHMFYNFINPVVFVLNRFPLKLMQSGNILCAYHKSIGLQVYNVVHSGVNHQSKCDMDKTTFKETT